MGILKKIFRGVKKVFKKVFNAVKKIVPIALAAAAVIFTGGAALGLLPTWGTVASGIAGSLFGSGTLGTVMAGALTQAGYGALAGGIMGSLLGGGFMKGAQIGALGGFITGGIGGLLAPPAPASTPLAGGGQMAVQGATKGVGTGVKASVKLAAQGTPAPAKGAIGAAVARSAPGAAQAVIGAQQAAVQAATQPSGGFMQSVKDFWNAIKDSRVAASVIEGVGQGLVQAAAADQTDMIKERAKQERRMLEQQFEGTEEVIGGMTPPVPTLPGAMAPVGLAPTGGKGRWVYDPTKKRIVFVPQAA